MPTLSGVWPGANWCERETWELFGIAFDGHPHLVKLVLLRAVRGLPDAEVVRAHEPRGQAVAGRRRGRGGGGLSVHAALALFGARTSGRGQQSFVNDWFSNFWVALVVKVVLVMVFVLTAPLAVGYMEHKVLAHMQSRLGPDGGRRASTAGRSWSPTA